MKMSRKKNANVFCIGFFFNVEKNGRKKLYKKCVFYKTTVALKKLFQNIKKKNIPKNIKKSPGGLNSLVRDGNISHLKKNRKNPKISGHMI